MAVSQQQVESALKEFIDPFLETDLVSAKAIKAIAVDGGAVTVEVALGFPAKGYRDRLAESLKEKISVLTGVTAVTINVDWKIEAHGAQKGAKPVPNIKNLIAV